MKKSVQRSPEFSKSTGKKKKSTEANSNTVWNLNRTQSMQQMVKFAKNDFIPESLLHSGSERQVNLVTKKTRNESIDY